MRRVAVLVIGLVALAACATSAPSRPVTLEPLWRTEGFADPESIAASADGRVLYVSNVSGEADARDGVGFISKLSVDGVPIEREWLRGLNAPKGLAVRGGALFAADIDTLVEIDIATGAVARRIQIDGAKFLNDVTIAPDGAVLVSDSGGAKIYAVKDGVVSIWLADDRLSAVNGLLPERDRLVITTMAGKLLAADWRAKTIVQLAEGIGDGDGVAALGGGHYIASEWPGRIFHVTPDGAHSVVLDTRAQGVLQNDFVLRGDTLIAPNWKPGAVTAWRVRR